jgi:hypothetical protein
MNIEEQIFKTVEAIDSVLGMGYARKNPELIGRVMQAAGIVEIEKTIISLSEEVFID